MAKLQKTNNMTPMYSKLIAAAVAIACLVVCGGLSTVCAADTKEKKQQLEPQFRHLFRTMGEKSSTKIKLVSGPEAIKMRNGQVPGKRWFATSGKFKFKLTIQDGVDLKVEKLIERLQKLPLPYVRAYEVVSDEKEDGVAVYKSLGGATAHGGKQYINIIPSAGPMVLAHEVGHTLEQKARESDPEILDKWEAAIEADKVSISNYGDKVRHEDLGEFSKVYAACLDAGEAQLSKLRKLSPARMQLWEKILKGQDVTTGKSSEDSAAARHLTLNLGKGVSMKLVLIPAGTFKMGNHDTPAETVKKVGGWMSWPGHPHHGRTDQRQIDEEHLTDEYPVHEVTISKPFYMGIYEVTQAQWKAVMGTEPWMAKQALGFARMQPRPEGFDDYPVAFVDSYDAIEFCRKLSKKTGRTVSLPTEAQWEYACRAGTTTTFSFGDDLSKLIDYGWYGGIHAGQKEDYAHRVGQLKPNPWGLYDMHGNVWEFCSDWYDKDFYGRSPSVDPENTTKTDKPTLRSGAFHSVPTVSRSAQRNSWTSPKTVRYNYGFRVVVAADKSVNGER